MPPHEGDEILASASVGKHQEDSEKVSDFLKAQLVRQCPGNL